MKKDLNAYFVSDIHLLNSFESKAKIFLTFLKTKAKTASHLFLLGDIFDLWVGDGFYFQIKFQPIINEFKSLVESGVEVIFCEGNHDIHIDKFMRKLGIKVYTTPQYVELENKVIRFEHGDLMNQEDHKYLKLRKILRSDIIRKVSFNLPSPLIALIGEPWTLAGYSKRKKQNKSLEEKIKIFSEKYAIDNHKKKKFDYLITGHTHLLEDKMFSNPNFRFINLGTWLKKPIVFNMNKSKTEFINL